MGAWMTRSESARCAAVDSAVEAEAAAAFAFLERLVAAPSTVGAERGAQEIVTAELARLGFEVSEFEVPAQTAAAPPGRPASAPKATCCPPITGWQSRWRTRTCPRREPPRTPRRSAPRLPPGTS